MLSPLARKSLPLSLECKCVEKINVWSCIEQTEKNAPEGVTPCVVFSKNHHRSYAILPWEDLLKIFVSLDRGNVLPPRLVDIIKEMGKFVDGQQ